MGVSSNGANVQDSTVLNCWRRLPFETNAKFSSSLLGLLLEENRRFANIKSIPGTVKQIQPRVALYCQLSTSVGWKTSSGGLVLVSKGNATFVVEQRRTISMRCRLLASVRPLHCIVFRIDV